MLQHHVVPSNQSERSDIKCHPLHGLDRQVSLFVREVSVADTSWHTGTHSPGVCCRNILMLGYQARDVS